MLQFSMSRVIGKYGEVGSKGGTNQNCCRFVCLRVSGFSLHYSILLEIGNIFILQGFFGGDNPDCQKVEDVSSNPIWLQALQLYVSFFHRGKFLNPVWFVYFQGSKCLNMFLISVVPKASQFPKCNLLKKDSEKHVRKWYVETHVHRKLDLGAGGNRTTISLEHIHLLTKWKDNMMRPEKAWKHNGET